MAVDGAPSPSPTASVDSGDGVEDEDDDLVPLSSVSAFRGRGRVTSEVRRSAKKPPVRPNVWEEEGRDGGSAPGRRGGFAPGDLVWAKAFPYTWWPGWVRGSRGIYRSVALFGGDRSQWLEESSIRGFEDEYLRMSKMAGARLACEVDCALAELGRRTALGMTCGCRGMVGAADKHLITQIAGERERFEPVEMLGFVLGVAVCARVDDGQTTLAIRVAAQVNAYRSHVPVARLVEVNEGFQPDETLDIVRGVAVSAWVDDVEAASVARVVAQVDTFRRFLSRCPHWVYQSPAGESDGSMSEDSEGSDLEMSFISLSETEEVEDSFSLYGNDMEEHDEEDSMMQEELQQGGDFCTINRIDYSVLDSDTEFEPPSDNRMEGVCYWGNEKGVAFDTERTCGVSYSNKDHHNQICNLIISSDSGKILSPSKDSSERDQANEFHVANVETGGVELSTNTNFDKSSVSVDSADGNINKSDSPCRYASHLDRFHGRDFDQTVVPDSSGEMHKKADFLFTGASTSCSLEPLELRTESRSQVFVDFSLKPQPSVIVETSDGEEDGLQFLHEMLCYLYCLASDPLNMRSESLLPSCRLVLRYRASIVQNISSLSSLICTDASEKAQELDVWDHHPMNESDEKHQDDMVADMCEHSSIERVLFHKCDDGTNLQACVEYHSDLRVPHTTGDNITIHSVAIVNDACKTVADEKCYAGTKFQSNAEVRLPGKILVDKRYTAASNRVLKGVSHLTFPVSHGCEIVTRKRRFDQVVTSAVSSSLHEANFLVSDVKPSIMSGILMDNKEPNDKKAVYHVKRSYRSDNSGILFQDNVGYDAATLQSSGNYSAAANTCGSNIESTTKACSSALPPTCRYEVSSRRKRRLDQPIHSYISDRQKNSFFTSITRLYASPLVKDPLSATDGGQQSPLIGRRTALSNSLHMKFPKGFDLPSKEDLQRIFRVFGPLDHLRTRVFFYTGAGKVVFLNPDDAVTAYNYVRRNKLFGTGMCFWLDAYENLRKEYSTQALSSSGTQMSALSLKSCLKISSICEDTRTRGRFDRAPVSR